MNVDNSFTWNIVESLDSLSIIFDRKRVIFRSTVDVLNRNWEKHIIF